MKTGGRLVKHARYYWLLLAEGHLTRRVRRDRAAAYDAVDACRVAEVLIAAYSGRPRGRRRE